MKVRIAMRARRTFHLFATTIALGLLAACTDDGDAASASSPQTEPPVTTAPDAGDATAQAPQDLVDTAVAAKSFDTLVAAVRAAGLEATFRGPGPFTLFAPTDEAFAKVPKFLTDKLLTAPYKAELGLILKYHAISGSVRAADVLGKTSSPQTLTGAKLA